MSADRLWSIEEQLELVKRDGLAIQYIQFIFVNLAPEVQLEAVKQNRQAIEYIDNPLLEVCCLAYPELADVLADPNLKCSDDPFRISCGDRLEALRKKFPLINRVFVT